MSSMKAIAVVCAAAFMFALVSPAFAQPFADVPTNHWAYDAIAELAAKGLIEGYPDGTFKGDRAMTRYEMAMVVARLLARIESIQIPAPAPPPPPPPPPQVTRADLDAISRLVNEFRAELAALGVRTTAIEEELNAIKARLDNVRITGGFRFREDVARASYGGLGTGVNISAGNGSTSAYVWTANPNTLNGNQRASTVDASVQPIGNRPRYEFKIGFDGSVTPDIHYVIALESLGTYNFFNSGQIGVPDNTLSANAGLSSTSVGSENSTGFNGGFGTVDTAFLDWRNPWGLPLEIMLGRFGANTPYGGGFYPLVWGPFGLLLNDTADTWEDATATGGWNEADGLRIQLHVPSWADLQAEFAIIRIMGGNGSPQGPGSFNANFGTSPSGAISTSQYLFGDDAYGINANIQVMPGLRIGADWISNTITPSNNTGGPAGFGNAADWMVYGPGGGSINPGNMGTLSRTSYHCVPNANLAAIGGPNYAGLNYQGDLGGGIDCPTLGSGWGAYVMWDIVPGIHFDGEYSQWNDAVFATSDNGYKVNINWNLGTLLGVGHNLMLNTGYENFGQNFYSPYGGAELDIQMGDVLYPGNGNAFTADVSFKPWDWLTVGGVGMWGNSASNGQALAEYDIWASYAFIQNASITVRVRELRVSGVEQFLLYRAQVDYTW